MPRRSLEPWAGLEPLEDLAGLCEQRLSLFEAFEAAFELGDVVKARELLAILDGLRPGQLTPVLAAHRARFGARLAAKQGDTDVATSFSTAESIFREHGLTFLMAVTELEHGEWLVAQGRGDEAEQLLAEARQIFERLEATPWIERANAVRPAEAVAS